MKHKTDNIDIVQDLLNECSNIRALNQEQVERLINSLTKLLDSHEKIDLVSKFQLQICLSECLTRAGKYDIAEEYYKEIISNIPNEEIIYYIQKAKNGIAILNAMKGNFRLSIEYWEQLVEEVQSLQFKADIFNNLGISYSLSDQYQKSLEYHYKSLLIDEEINLEHAIATNYINLANTYRKLKQYERSLELHQKAIKLYIKQNNMHYVASGYHNISTVYSDLLQFKDAIRYEMKALKLKKLYGNDLEQANSLINLSTIYKMQGNYKQALKYIKLGCSIFEKGIDKFSYIGSMTLLGSILLEMGQLEKAEEILLKNYELAKENGSVTLISDVTNVLHKYYYQVGDYQRAYNSLNEYLQVYQQLDSANPQKMVAQAEVEYYRKKADDQHECYRLNNIELLEKNKIITEKTNALNKAIANVETSYSVLKKLVSVIGHDVRGPITTWKQAIKMILENNFEPEEIINLLQGIVVSSSSTIDILDELLLLVKNTQKSSNIEMDDIDVVPIIDDVISIYRTLATNKNISINFRYSKSFYVYADASLMKIIIRNLIHNALKFTSNKGQIQIKLTKNKFYNSIIIQDSGIGLTKQQIADIYNASRFTNLGTNNEPGSGIGLGLCIDYLKQMKCKLKIVSTPGIGSKFSILVPIHIE